MVLRTSLELLIWLKKIYGSFGASYLKVHLKIAEDRL